MNTRTRWAWALLLAAAAPSLGCTNTSSCSREKDKIDVYNGYRNADHTIYSSIDVEKQYAPDGGPAEAGTLPSFTYFPANRTVVFHVGLAAYPYSVLPYLSFSPDGDATVALSAGNQSLIRKRSKDEVILANDTCSEFWVWLTASTSDTPFEPQIPDDGSAGAGSSDGAAGAASSEEAAGAPGAP